MKNILVIMILAGSGYWYYNNIVSPPLLGKWAPDEKTFLSIAYKNGMPKSQAKSIKKLVGSISMTIKDDGKITYDFGKVGGDLSYESSPRIDGCFDLDVVKLGSYKACVENGMLAMHSNQDGKVEYYTKIQ
jgi:hypothetical protein